MQSANVHQHEISAHSNNGWVIADNIKPAIAWLLTISVVSAAAGFLLTNIALLSTGKYLFALFFLLTGMPHVLIFPKWLPHLHSINRLLFTLLLSLVITAVLFVVFSMQSYIAGLLPVTAASAFMVQACWYYFSGIQPVYNAWYMPDNMRLETRMSLLLLNSIPFSINIKANEKDRLYIQFPVAINCKLTMDVLFTRFLYDQQSTVEVANGTGWLFFVKRWYGMKALDPTATLSKNNIKPGDMIIVERAAK
jgi:hypothetical protein